jgi:glycosyltransferase involved in cell wall biosynthesis
MRVLLLSPYGTKVNPYIELLSEGLMAANASVTTRRVLAAEDLAGSERPDVVHAHWIEGYDRGAETGSRALARLSAIGPVRDGRRWARLAGLLDALARFQAAGGLVIYTAHNLDPHEATGWPERRALRSIIRSADLIHTHDHSTAGELGERFGRREGIAVIPHGHYISAYPNTTNRDEARARLGIDADAFVYACLGLMRPYKGLEELIPAFRALDADHARLLIVGKAHDTRYAARLAELAGGDTRIGLEPRFVPGDELQLYFNAADVAVLPYRQITTSGAAMMAFSFGAPVLAPAIGAFPDLIGSGRGILYPPGDLATALRDAQARDWAPARGPILEWVRQFDWADIGRALIRAYERAKER